MQISQRTLDAAARFRAAQDDLLSLNLKTTPIERLQGAVATHQKAMEDLAYAALDDVRGITQGSRQ